MRTRLFLWAAAAAWMGLVPLGVNRADTPSAGDGPVSYWDFDGSLKDAAGDVKDDLTARNQQRGESKARFVTATDIPGVSGRAVALGVESPVAQYPDAQYLTAAISDDVRLGPSYTIEAWIHPTQVGGWNRLVLQWGGGPTYAYHFALRNGVVSLCHGQSDGKYIFCDGGAVTTGQLQHIAGVARRNEEYPAQSKLTVYLGGRQTASATFDGTIGKLSDALGIGDSGSGGGDGVRFRGYVDEISIWNRALSAEEIKAHCNAPARVEAVRQSELVRAQIQ